MLWAIKRSFQHYIASLPDGVRSVTDGAATAADQEFLFPLIGGVELERMAPGTRLRFVGDVRFRGHGGMLFLVFADPEVEIVSTDSAILSVKTHVPGSAELQRVDVASLRLPAMEKTEGYLLWAGIIAVLTTAGADLFNGVYEAGTALETVSILLGRDELSAS
jgi:hypothetical protein